MRIDALSYSNILTQGAQRRETLRALSPQHLEHCSSLMLQGLRERKLSVSPNVLVLGAGACTEIPLLELTRGSDEVVLADLDLASSIFLAKHFIQRGWSGRDLWYLNGIRNSYSSLLKRSLSRR